MIFRTFSGRVRLDFLAVFQSEYFTFLLGRLKISRLKHFRIHKVQNRRLFSSDELKLLFLQTNSPSTLRVGNPTQYT
jgi:hypothetical protein